MPWKREWRNDFEESVGLIVGAVAAGREELGKSWCSRVFPALCPILGQKHDPSSIETTTMGQMETLNVPGPPFPLAPSFHSWKILFQLLTQISCDCFSHLFLNEVWLGFRILDQPNQLLKHLPWRLKYKNISLIRYPSKVLPHAASAIKCPNGANNASCYVFRAPFNLFSPK